MATYPFWKLHGLGNDFVFFDAMEEELELSTAEVAALCDRHTGIGGDGVIVVKPSPRSECAGYMHYINAMARSHRCAATACAASRNSLSTTAT